MTTRYVLMVALDLDTGFTVGLTKLKGPSFLLKKVTFPGGKMEGTETPQQAAEREMFEETGLSIDAAQWHLYETVRGEGYELFKLVALSSKVLHARTREEEPVWHLAIQSHKEYAQRQPEQYAPDFLSTLDAALAYAQQLTEMQEFAETAVPA